MIRTFKNSEVEIVKLEEKTISCIYKCGPTKHKRFYVFLRFGDVEKKLAVSKTVADWIRNG
jgi:hypothetical protein